MHSFGRYLGFPVWFRGHASGGGCGPISRYNVRCAQVTFVWVFVLFEMPGGAMMEASGFVCDITPSLARRVDRYLALPICLRMLGGGVLSHNNLSKSWLCVFAYRFGDCLDFSSCGPLLYNHNPSPARHKLVGGYCCSRQDEHRMLLESEDADECFSKDDLTCVGKTIDSHMTAEASFNDITAFIQSRLPRKKAQFQGSKTAFPPQAADSSEEVFLQLAPPGARVRCDRFNGRWQAFLRVPPGP